MVSPSLPEPLVKGKMASRGLLAWAKAFGMIGNIAASTQKTARHTVNRFCDDSVPFILLLL